MKKLDIVLAMSDSLSAMAAERILCEEGHRVVQTVSTGQEVLQAVEEQQPDLIVMAIELAGPMDGIEAASLVQSVSDVPVLYITDAIDRASISRLKEIQKFKLIITPFSKTELHHSVQSFNYN